MGKRGLVALLNLSSWCLVMVERLFLAVPRGCLQFVIVVFPDHTHLLLFKMLHVKAAESVTFDLLILKIIFLFFKNTVKYSNSGKHFTIFVNHNKLSLSKQLYLC